MSLQRPLPCYVLCLLSALLFAPGAGAIAAAPSNLPIDPEFEEILSLDIAQLSVTSVSRRAEPMKNAAAAVYVLTGEDIRRMGATNIPEALRMVPGVNVARAGSNRWAISARGFNGVLASKLLVLIDGRTVYSPIFSGTYWDDKTTLLEDIDRIEVIRGPGGTLYGANAVNGIINIITKHAEATQGEYARVGIGNEEKRAEFRHGGQSGEDDYYRAYGQLADYDSTKTYGADAQNPDDWWNARAGFRYDLNQEEADRFTLQGDAYQGRYETTQNLWQPDGTITPLTGSEASVGANMVGRWTRDLSEHSQTSLQAYLDHYSRNEINFDQHVTTADVQFQHNLQVNPRNHFTWGAGYRLAFLNMHSTFSNSVVTDDTARSIPSFFLQHEYAVLPEELLFTVGSKFEHNDFTGFEFQPSARLSWQATESQTLWAAVSRAVRTPSEIEDQAVAVVAVLPGAPPLSFGLTGESTQQAEELIAYELGYRVQPMPSLSVDTALFFNDYDRLNAFSAFGAPYPYRGTLLTPIPFNNLGRGETYGGEVAMDWKARDDWQLSASYSYLNMHLRTHSDALAAFYREDDAPHHQLVLRSYYDITDDVQWDNMLYFTDEVAAPADAYWRYDTRIGWQAQPGVELSLVGRNLLDNAHAEYPYAPQGEIERSVLGLVTLRF